MPESRQELYKSYLSDLASTGTRYTAGNAFYLSILTALVGIMALSEANRPLAQMRPGLVLCISVVAWVVCWIWSKTIAFYAHLFRVKFEVLRALEEPFEIKPYQLEQAALLKAQSEPLTKNERRVPLTIGILFGAISSAAFAARVLS